METTNQVSLNGGGSSVITLCLIGIIITISQFILSYFVSERLKNFLNILGLFLSFIILICVGYIALHEKIQQNKR